MIFELLLYMCWIWYCKILYMFVKLLVRCPVKPEHKLDIHSSVVTSWILVPNNSGIL